MYSIRKTNTNDLEQLLLMYSNARIRMRKNGINQWQDNYPNLDVLLKDINNNESYVFIDNSNTIVATAMISSKVDPTYNYIEGNWGNNNKYIVIHRFVVSTINTNNGIGSKFLNSIKQLYPNTTIRIDTHKDNYLMKNFLTKYGFTYRGIIYLDNKESREAYDY